ncbi:MAG: phosphopantothenoylcysteine decarboxylase [Planctomycetes bacterium]|nr:phosphopantothenoylcysteine decarboxylase [Planctomycetota bacterium]
MQLLVTAGPTREYLDTVRYLSNASSGRMGYAIAAEAARRGHKVTLVSGPVELPDPAGVDVVRVVSAHAMLRAAVALFEECRAAIMAAAVADYRPATRRDQKMKKRRRSMSIQLVPTEDICAHLGRDKGNRIVVGFAMEDHDHHEHAMEKLRRKHCDAIVLNGPGNVGGESGEIEIFRDDIGWQPARSGTKAQLAGAVVDLVEDLIATGRRDAGIPF